MAQAAESLEDPEILAPITVTAQRVANLQPATTYASTATTLRFDPLINLQARGLPEGQADITVRGGLFENTGFRIGAVTVFDPQTGHYSVELPIDPGLLSYPEVLTDFDNGLNAFNASVATVGYGFNTISKGGSISAGLGSDKLAYGTVRASQLRELSNGNVLGGTISASGSTGDGTLPYGDHNFKRFSGQLQLLAQDSETNLLLGYHDRFMGWPGMYTGFASLPETDHTKLGLVVLDHRWSNQRGWVEVGTAYRWLEDDYDFDRLTVETGGPGSFEHATRSFSLGLAGLQQALGLDWYFSGQFSADRLVRSTDLTHGNFNSRSYLTMSLAPGREWAVGSELIVAARAGLRIDASNRDENALMPLFALTLEQGVGSGVSRYGLEYSRVSQLPGYTALNSPPQGLFGGNPDLGREYANTVTLSFTHEQAAWLARFAAFYRHDDDLVDWTYLSGAPYIRQANPVDMNVTGLEGVISWQSTVLEILGSYAWLHKNANYGSAQVDASYYALNFARHRFTLALVYSPLEQLEFRLDNEYRIQQQNVLRTSSDRAYNASLSVNWRLTSLPQPCASCWLLTTSAIRIFRNFRAHPRWAGRSALGLEWTGRAQESTQFFINTLIWAW